MATTHLQSRSTARSSNQPLAILFARFGYGARGIVYILVGCLAILAALGLRGTTDSRGALIIVLEQPLGWIWLGVIGAGLGLFALWRLAQSIFDADGLGTSLMMVGRRAAYLISAIGNAALAWVAVSMALGLAARGTGGESSAKTLAAWLLQHHYGAWVTMALGFGVIAAGLVLVWQAWKVDRIVEFFDCPPAQRWWAVPAGRFGYAARGIVFGLIGGFLALAGYQGRSDEAKGLGGALDSLAALPNGWLLLAATATGLASFGLFGLAQAFYRNITPPQLNDSSNATSKLGARH